MYPHFAPVIVRYQRTIKKPQGWQDPMWQIVHPILIREVYMSYFKIIPSKSAKAYKNLTKNLNISDQFKKINDLYRDFLTFYDNKYKFVKEYGFENLKDEQKFKGLEKNR